MKDIKVLFDPAWWQALAGNDFNKGFIAALCLILLLMLLLFIVRSVIFLIFRTRRCSYVEVKRGDGSTVISRDVISSVVERELVDYPAVKAEKIVLTRRGQRYQLTIYCTYFLADQSGIPAFCDEFKPKLKGALEKGFGITSLEKIKLWISEPDQGGNGSSEAPSINVPDKDAYIGL